MPYSLSYRPEAKADIAKFIRQSREGAFYGEFLECLKEADRRMKLDPLFWGDILSDHRYIEAYRYRGMIPHWILVWYGVDIRSQSVVIRRIGPAPGSPLVE